MILSTGRLLASLALTVLLSGPPLTAQGPLPSPEVGWEHNNLGMVYLATGRFDEAASAFQKAAAAMSADGAEAAKARYNLALTLYRARRFEAALAALGPGPDPPLRTPRAAVLRARLLQAMGRRDEALRVWDELRRDGALDIPSLWHLARLLLASERAAPAEEILTELGRRATEPGVLETERAEALAALGRLTDALAAAHRATGELGRGDEELAALLTEAEQAVQAGGAAGASTTISMAANILRSTEGYIAGLRRLQLYGSGSPLSEEPLSFDGTPAPGAAPPPLSAGGKTVPVGSAQALCLIPGGLLAVGAEGRVLLLQGKEGEWGPGERSPGSAAECASADLDQDGTAERVLVAADAVLVEWPQGEPARLPGAATGSTFLDYDLDGDTDLVTVGPAGARLWRNNRDRTFTEVTRETGLAAAAPGAAVGALAVDLTGDGSAELYVIRAAGPNVLVGGLHEEKATVLATPGEAGGAATAADCDHDGDLDLLAGGRLLVNDGLGRFEDRALPAAALPAAAAARRLGTADLDLDGFPDLLALGAGGRLDVLRGTGACAFTPWPGEHPEQVRDVVVADLDGDGAPELALLAADGVRIVEGTPTGRAILVRPRGTKDNTDALGSRVDLWAGRLRLRHEIRRGTHEIIPEGADLPLGLGPRAQAQWVRILWPNNTWASQETVAPGPLAVEQSRDLEGSCPFLYTWNGDRFAFVTDLLGGSPLGLPLARNIHMPTDPDEYVLLPPDRLAEKDGRYDLRITVELREMLYLDQLELVTVDYPAGAAVATDDGLRPPPFPPFHLYATSSARPPIAAEDHAGRDVLDRLLRVDGRYPDGFEWIRYQGYAETHSVVLDFGELDRTEGAFLLLTGGYYWSEADNLALSQAQTVSALLPRLEVWRDGAWTTVLETMAFPGGRAKTLAIDLQGALQPGRVRLRITTNLRLYFDQILLGIQDLPAERLEVRRLRPTEATLGWHGYSALGPFDGRVPPPFDYRTTHPAKPYANIEGFYTRYGDVMPLLAEKDNASVILHHGDEVAVSFEAPPPPPPGWVRDVFVYSVGWDKDAHPNSTTGTTVEPLPFHGMTAYPYTAPERYPWTPELREMRRIYQTRWIPRS